jgi:uncharacterized membrane protein YhhN
MSGKSSALFLNILIIAAIFVLNYFYQKNKFAFSLKCICSAAFALLGIINLSFALATGRENSEFFILMSAALVLAMLGDILIDKSFALGAGSFALGHIGFAVAYSFLQGFSLLDVIIIGVIFSATAAFLLFAPCVDFGSKTNKWICLSYSFIISVMLGKAMANLICQANAVNAIIAAGSFLFFFSDLMLVLNWFVGVGKWAGNACMGTYYPALCFLAFSMYLKAF